MGEIIKSDERLIEDFHRGNDAVFDELLERYKNLVRKKASALYLVGGDHDDLIQEGMIGLYKAVRSYEKNREKPFATYASMCINHQMCSAIAKANRQKNVPLNEAVSYFDVIRKGDGEEYSLECILSDNNRENPEYRFMDEISAKMIQEKIMDQLSRYEKTVLLLHMDGLGYVQIAAALGKSPKSVDNALNRIKVKASQLLE